MSVKLQREHIRLSEVLCSGYCQTTVESDVIVPDIKPDILKILQVDSNVIITQKEVRADKVFVQGCVRLNIIYVPDLRTPKAVKSIAVSQEFSHSIEAKGARQGMEACVDAECEPAEYTLVNSRKLSVRSKIGLSARLADCNELDIATGLEENSPVEVKTRCMKIHNPCIDTVRDIIVRERLEVPQGKPDICEVLKFSVKPLPVGLQLLLGTAHAKGELKISTLYCSDEEGSAPEVMEHTVPFSEVLEIEKLSEEMCGEAEYRVKDCYFEICQDSDGDKRILSCEITLETAVRAYETVECTVIEDAYGLNNPVQLEMSTYNIEQLVGSNTMQIAIKEPVNVPDYLPEVQRLCDCNANATIENISINGSEVTVSGYISCSFMYLSEDTAMPVAGFAHILPFSQSCEMEGLSSESVCDAKADVEHISCTISAAKCFEIRAALSVAVKVVTPLSAKLVSGISCCEEECLPKRPSMAVYFVQKGDTLWSIAKRFCISPESILAANGDESEILKPGRCIYIFR